MALRLQAAIRGDLRRFMAADITAGEQAVTSAVRRRTSALKNNLRKGIRRAGLGARLEKTIQSAVYPARGSSIKAKGQVWSKAIYKRPGGLADLITVFDEGATIRPRRSKYLAIPLFKRPGTRKKEGFDPSSFGRGAFRFIPIVPGKSALLVDRNTEEAMFYLVKRTRITARGINVDAQVAKSMRGIDDLIAREWERRARRAGVIEEAA